MVLSSTPSSTPSKALIDIKCSPPSKVKASPLLKATPPPKVYALLKTSPQTSSKMSPPQQVTPELKFALPPPTSPEKDCPPLTLPAAPDMPSIEEAMRFQRLPRGPRCRICREPGHTFLKCPQNVMLYSSRRGQKRTFCKKLSLTSPKIERLEIFTSPIPNSGRIAGSEKLLGEAKEKCWKELDRLEALVDAPKISGFEKAWFEASGETELWFNFAGMRDNVVNAKFGVKDFDGDTFGHNNNVQVILNKTKPMNLDEIVKVLLHECMHHNVTRVSERGHLNEDIDHLALALLGDPNECDNFRLGWLQCVFSKCKNPRCLKYDWD